MEERVAVLQRLLRHAEMTVLHWEAFHRQNVQTGAYIGCNRAAAVSAAGGWPVIQVMLDGNALRLVAALLSLAAVLAAVVTAALVRAFIAMWLTYGPA